MVRFSVAPLPLAALRRGRRRLRGGRHALFGGVGGGGSDLAVKEFAQPEAGRDPGVANLPRRNVAALEQVERRAEFGVDFLGNGFRAPQELVALVVRRGVRVSSAPNLRSAEVVLDASRSVEAAIADLRGHVEAFLAGVAA
jgi:hypothetical protein